MKPKFYIRLALQGCELRQHGTSLSLGSLGVMNLALLRVVGLSAICVCMVGCSRTVPPQTKSASQPLYTEADVRSFVLPGTSLNEIVKRFGQPISVEKNPKFEDGSTKIDEIVYFDFGLPRPEAKEDVVFCGFQVRLKDGKAVQWFSNQRSSWLSRVPSLQSVE